MTFTILRTPHVSVDLTQAIRPLVGIYLLLHFWQFNTTSGHANFYSYECRRLRDEYKWILKFNCISKKYSFIIINFWKNVKLILEKRKSLPKSCSNILGDFHVAKTLKYATALCLWPILFYGPTVLSRIPFCLGSIERPSLMAHYDPKFILTNFLILFWLVTLTLAVSKSPM